MEQIEKIINELDVYQIAKASALLDERLAYLRKVADDNNPLNFLLIKDFNQSLSTRACSVLRNNGIITARDLSKLTIRNIGELRHCGKKTVSEIVDFAKTFHINPLTQ